MVQKSISFSAITFVEWGLMIFYSLYLFYKICEDKIEKKLGMKSEWVWVGIFRSDKWIMQLMFLSYLKLLSINSIHLPWLLFLSVSPFCISLSHSLTHSLTHSFFCPFSLQDKLTWRTHLKVAMKSILENKIFWNQFRNVDNQMKVKQ